MIMTGMRSWILQVTFGSCNCDIWEVAFTADDMHVCFIDFLFENVVSKGFDVQIEVLAWALTPYFWHDYHPLIVTVVELFLPRLSAHSCDIRFWGAFLEEIAVRDSGGLSVMDEDGQSHRQQAGVGTDFVLKSFTEECRSSSTQPFVFVNGEKQAIPLNSANITLLQFLRGEHGFFFFCPDRPFCVRQTHRF